MLNIVKWPDPVLRKIGEVVPDSAFGQKLVDLGYEMIETLLATDNGVGLAAPQVGKSLQMFVMTVAAENVKNRNEWNTLVAVNPKIELGGKILHEREGCLSFPGYWEDVERPEFAVLTYQEPLNGFWKEIKLVGFDARVAGHEFDHCQGMLFFDRIPKNARKALLRKWEKQNG